MDEWISIKTDTHTPSDINEKTSIYSYYTENIKKHLGKIKNITYDYAMLIYYNYIPRYQ